MRTFLLTDGEFTGLIRALKSLPEPVRIVGFTESEYTAHNSFLDASYQAPDWRDDAYLPFLLNVIRKERVDLIFPVGTLSLPYLASQAERIQQETGAVLITSPEKVLHIANNKARLFDALAKTELSGIITEFKTAKTVGELKTACRFFTDRGISCISKPVCGENAEGFMRFVPEEDYARRRLSGTAASLASLSLFDCLPEEEALPEERLVMPYLPGEEWDVDVLAAEGEILAATVRKNHSMFGGLSSCTETVDREDLLDYCRGIVRHLGLRYLSCISFRADENGNPKLLEINPRAMGSIYLSTLAGNSLVEKLLDFPEFRGLSVFPESAVSGPAAPESGTAARPVSFPAPRITRPGFAASLYYDLAVVRDEKEPAEDPDDICWNDLEPPVREIYEEYYHRVRNKICDTVFNCRFAWDRMYHFRWAILEDCLVQVSYGSPWSDPFMLMPLGEFDTEKLDRILTRVRKDFAKHDLPLTVYGIGHAYLPYFEALRTPHEAPVFSDNFSDYLYSGDDLRNLAGRKYAKKRNHIAHFQKEHPDAVYESLGPAHLEGCLDLVRRWALARGIDLLDPEGCDYSEIKNLFDHWDLLDVRGGVILLDGKVAAFSMGSLEGDIAFIHFEKAEADIDGLYPVINQQTLLHEFPEVRFVNREEDLGIPGLRQAKQSYYPVELVRKYKMRIL